MGKKQQQQGWPEAKRLCRLNRNDVEMAKRLGFRADVLIRSIPSRKQMWKLPVNQWVRELYRERFGYVLGQKPHPAPAPPAYVELDAEDMRRIEEEFYWEDYRARNEEDVPKNHKRSQAKPAKSPFVVAAPGKQDRIDDDSLPF